MEVLPAPKFAQRQWRFARKRRRSGAEGVETEGTLYSIISSSSWSDFYRFWFLPTFWFLGDPKLVKKDGEATEKMDTTDGGGAKEPAADKPAAAAPAPAQTAATPAKVAAKKA